MAISPAENVNPTLTLLVLRTRDLSGSRAFCEALGLSFVAERHGDGPEHFAATLGGLVLELYPLKHEESPCESTRLGFRLSSLDAVVDRLRATGVTIVAPPRQTPWGRRAVVADPDGRRVELVDG